MAASVGNTALYGTARTRTGKLEHDGFLDLSGGDPSKAFAEHLVAACGERGPIFVYNAGFESARIRELAERCLQLDDLARKQLRKLGRDIRPGSSRF